MKEIKKIKILVLDDSQARLDTFKENIEQKLKVLNSTDYAKTADEAIEFLKKNLDYDYIFLDRDLGDNVPSGEDVVSYIINNNPLKVIPLLVYLSLIFISFVKKIFINPISTMLLVDICNDILQLLILNTFFCLQEHSTSG